MTEKRRGRPAEFAEPMHPVTTRIPQSVEQAASRLAVRTGQSLAEVVRGAVTDYVARNRQAVQSKAG